jgi:hypothetical protein
LSNKASILSTFDSSHTRRRIIRSDEDEDIEINEDEDMDVSVPMPDDLKSLRRMNRENTASQAARLKIIETHFCERNINMQIQPFMDMDPCARHHVIAWMAKDGCSWLYRFLRAMPSLLERAEAEGKVGGKKRRR